MYASERDMRVHQLQVARASEDATLPGRGFAHRLHAHNHIACTLTTHRSLMCCILICVQSRSQTFVALEITKRNDRVLVIRFTAQSQSGSMACHGAWLFLCYLKMVAPRALLLRPLVKGNEALGTRLSSPRIFDEKKDCAQSKRIQ